MTIDQLIYFLSAAQTGSINSCAQQFFVTQQAINASLKKLEAELAVTLLNRDYKGVTLTPEGRIFQKHAQNILHEYRQSLLELRRYRSHSQEVRGTLSLFAASIFTDLFLPDVIRDFTGIYPGAAIKIIEVSNDDLLSYLFNHYCDLVLFSASKQYITDTVRAAGQTDIKILPLLKDQQVICVRRDHPLAACKEISRAMLQDYWSTDEFKFSLYHVLPMNMRELVYAQSVSTSDNAELHKKLILENIALTYMPYIAYQYKFDSDTFAAIPLSDAHEISHCLLYRDTPAAPNHALLQAFVQYIRDYFALIFGARILPSA